MVVHIHSLGSLWQVSEGPCGSAIWNTTGVMVQNRLRSRAISYGQISLGRLARLAYAHVGCELHGNWQADMVSRGNDRIVRLVRPSPRNATPECSLVRATSGTIGHFTAADTDQQSSLISLSAYKESVEALILMRAYGWVRGSHGSVTLLPNGMSFNLRLVRWE